MTAQELIAILAKLPPETVIKTVTTEDQMALEGSKDVVLEINDDGSITIMGANGYGEPRIWPDFKYIHD